jgi:glycosyltransferase involved in cell wall biosynthesis
VRISIIGPAYPFRGGIAHHVYYLQTELGRRNHEVQVISYKKLYPKMFFPGKTMLDSSHLALDPAGIAILDPIHPATWLEAFKAIRAFAPNLVLIQWWNPFCGPALGTLARLLRVSGLNYVMECHNVFPHERSLLDLPLVDFAFGPVQRFITHSREDRALLIDSFPSKKAWTAPLPAPAFLSGHSASLRTGRRILFFGMVRKYKGLDILLAAMPRVLAKVECNLLIAGEFYDPVNDYLAMVQGLGLGPHVEIRDQYVPNEEVGTLLDQADLLVMPYLSATQSGIVQMALQKALPIIASRTGGLAEAVIENETGLLCNPGDPESLSEAIVSYFTGNLGQMMSEKMRLRSKEDRPSELCLLIENLGEPSNPTI